MHSFAISVKVFPVPTGMNRYTAGLGLLWVCVPRAHGDEPREYFAGLAMQGCSPCPRG